MLCQLMASLLLCLAQYWQQTRAQSTCNANKVKREGELELERERGRVHFTVSAGKMFCNYLAWIITQRMQIAANDVAYSQHF